MASGAGQEQMILVKFSRFSIDKVVLQHKIDDCQPMGCDWIAQNCPNRLKLPCIMWTVELETFLSTFWRDCTLLLGFFFNFSSSLLLVPRKLSMCRTLRTWTQATELYTEEEKKRENNIFSNEERKCGRQTCEWRANGMEEEDEGKVQSRQNIFVLVSCFIPLRCAGTKPLTSRYTTYYACGCSIFWIWIWTCARVNGH